MAVLISNTSLAVRRRQDATRDAHGEPLPAGWDTAGQLAAGFAHERADGTWSLGLDPSTAPVQTGDLVVDDAGSEWLVVTADRLSSSIDPTVDWIRVDARRRVAGSTAPPGAEFADSR